MGCAKATTVSTVCFMLRYLTLAAWYMLLYNEVAVQAVLRLVSSTAQELDLP